MTRRHEVIADIVEALAETEGCRPEDLDYSLYDHFKMEVLLTLVTSEHTDWAVSFEVPDHTVEVHGDGRILVDGAVVREAERSSVPME